MQGEEKEPPQSSGITQGLGWKGPQIPPPAIPHLLAPQGAPSPVQAGRGWRPRPAKLKERPSPCAAPRGPSEDAGNSGFGARTKRQPQHQHVPGSFPVPDPNRGTAGAAAGKKSRPCPEKLQIWENSAFPPGPSVVSWNWNLPSATSFPGVPEALR